MPFFKKITKSLSLSTLALIMSAGSTLSLAPATAFAQENLPSRQFSAAAGKVVSEALLLIDAGKHEDALAQLLTLSNGVSLNAYERSTVYQMQGSAYYELNQYEKAIGAFENAVQAGGLLPAETKMLKLNAAQLRIGNGQYAKGAAALEDYFLRGGESKPQLIEILVQAWVQADELAKALPWAEQWFETAAPKERRHYDLMNYLYANLGMKDYQADILSQMILLWPDDDTLRSALSVIKTGPQ